MNTHPQWADTAVWYAIYPLGFVGAPPSLPGMLDGDECAYQRGFHRLRQVIGWLDHLIELGCNGLLLGPIFASQTHGYDTIDYFAIDPRLGDENDFDDLVAACRKRGIRLMLDGVFNHVGHTHPAFREGLTNPQSDYSEWFFFQRENDPTTWLNFEGSDNLVRLNHAHQPVRDYIYRIMSYWLGKGIDAWRLDAAYAIDPHMWADLLPRLREQFPESLFMAEVIHADCADIERSTVDSMTAYELWKAIWSSIKDRNFFELDWTLKRHNEIADILVPLTFVSNHDVTRITSQIGVPGAVVSLAILATVPGMPAIYYGDEGGIYGIKYDRPGGDDEIRPALPADPTQWVMPHPELLGHHQSLIGLRRRNPWLVDARLTTQELTNTHMRYKAENGEDSAQVDISLDDPWQIHITCSHGDEFHYVQA